MTHPTDKARRSAEAIATQAISDDLKPETLRAVAYALGCQDADAVLAHLNPKVLKSRLAHVLVEAVIEAMEDAQASAA
jgi:acyl-CoA synthetase (AMP-forming)/AMP-acid ligase II